jgi:hypothetical protein
VSWLSDKLKEAVPYAMMAFPFTPWGAGLGTLMQTKAPWMAKMMNSKFMNSVLGASAKDAGISYLQAKMMGKDNPHLMAQNALTRNLFLNANKVGWDWNQMMGGNPEIDIADYMQDVTKTIPGVEKWSEPTGGYGNVIPKISYVPTKYEEAIGPNVIGDYPFLTNLDGQKATEWGFDVENLKEQTDLIKPGRWFTTPDETISKTIIPSPLETFEQIEKDRINPLAGTGFLTTTKTGPNMMDRLLGRVRDAKDAGITRGSDEWNEMFDVGTVGPDYAKAAGWLWDYLSNPQTEGDIEEDKERAHEDFMAKLMWPRSMEDVPDFEGSFLGNKGGVASYRRGGTKRPEKPGGSMDAFLDWWLNREALGGLRFSPTGGNTPPTDMYEFEKLFLGNKGGIASLSNGGMGPYSNPYPDDDPNVDVQDILQGPGFESIDELGALFGEDEIAMSQPHPMEGWYDMFFDTFGRYPNNEAELIQFINESDVDLQQTGRSIGPNPTFEDEFGGYLDLASGGKEPWEIRAEIDDLNNILSEISDPGQRQIIEIQINELLGQLGTGPSAARGGRIGMYGGGDLNAIPGGAVSGPGTETSDSVPAQLSNNEFVVTADAVRAAGGGDIDLGAQKFYGIMNALDPNSARPGEPPVYS